MEPLTLNDPENIENLAWVFTINLIVPFKFSERGAVIISKMSGGVKIIFEFISEPQKKNRTKLEFNILPKMQ